MNTDKNEFAFGLIGVYPRSSAPSFRMCPLPSPADTTQGFRDLGMLATVEGNRHLRRQRSLAHTPTGLQSLGHRPVRLEAGGSMSDGLPQAALRRSGFVTRGVKHCKIVPGI